MKLKLRMLTRKREKIPKSERLTDGRDETDRKVTYV